MDAGGSVAGSRESTLRRQIAVAVVSGTLLALQVGFTRVLSVVVNFHLVFLVLSVAMLGVGIPAAFLIVYPPSDRTAPRALVVAAAAIPAAIVALLRLATPSVDHTLPIAIVCLLVPFLSLGAAAAALLMLAKGTAFRRVYAADLVGGAAGALGILALMDWVPTPPLVAALSWPAAAVVAWLGGRTERALSAVIAAAVLSIIIWGDPLRVRSTKYYDESHLSAHRIAERWSSTIRLAVFDRPFFRNNDTLFTWGPGRKAPRVPLAEYWIEQDGAAGTPVIKFDGDLTKLAALDYDATSLGYQIRPARAALIVGPGGGRDILTALRLGVETVRALEVNRGMIELMNGPLRGFSGGIYTHPRVHVELAEARSYLARTDERFDALQVSLIDSWAATAAGAHALSEGYLYTVEAMQVFMRALRPRGVLAVSRWDFEAARLIGTVSAAALAEGWTPVGSHLLVGSGSAIVTVLASPAPFTAGEIQSARALAELRGWDIVHPAPSSTEGLCLERGGIPCAPPPAVDDRPFFYISERAFSTRIFGKDQWLGRIREVALLTFLGLLLSLFLPLYRERKTLPFSVIAAGFYYALIGMVFMLVEVGLAHRFVEYIGHPTTSASVVLTGLLLGAGTGSYVLPDRQPRVWLLGTQIAIVLVALVAPTLFAHTRWFNAAGRGIVAGLLTVSIAFQLGAWFPSGLLCFGERRKAWFWLVNGTASVTGGLLALGVAIDFGFTRLFIVAAALYLCAAALLGAHPRASSAAQL